MERRGKWPEIQTHCLSSVAPGKFTSACAILSREILKSRDGASAQLVEALGTAVLRDAGALEDARMDALPLQTTQTLRWPCRKPRSHTRETFVTFPTSVEARLSPGILKSTNVFHTHASWRQVSPPLFFTMTRQPLGTPKAWILGVCRLVRMKRNTSPLSLCEVAQVSPHHGGKYKGAPVHVVIYK